MANDNEVLRAIRERRSVRRFRADGLQSGGKPDGRQAGAVPEGIGAQAGDAVGHYGD